MQVADALVVIVRLAALELRIALGTLPVPPLQDGESEFDAQIIAKERQTKLAEASALLKAVAASEAAGSGGAEQEEVFADVVSFAFDPTTAFLLDHDDADKPKECSKCASRDWVDP